MNHRHHSQCFLTDHHEGPCQYMTVSDGVKPRPAPEPRQLQLARIAELWSIVLSFIATTPGSKHNKELMEVVGEMPTLLASVPPAAEPPPNYGLSIKHGDPRYEHIAPAREARAETPQSEARPEFLTLVNFPEKLQTLANSLTECELSLKLSFYAKALKRLVAERGAGGDAEEPPPNYGLSIKHGDPRYEQTSPEKEKG